MKRGMKVAVCYDGKYGRRDVLLSIARSVHGSA